ncbi:unnamed protein product [Pleuronectes platessa]|uniref:Uncharacterized protein n=1 Tax=Pleuronectes platessa TaxID=8262 RepID=A0A9N7UMW6_PLEPL|nr:unnamed protein product [Pleuronectes platessa]
MGGPCQLHINTAPTDVCICQRALPLAARPAGSKPTVEALTVQRCHVAATDTDVSTNRRLPDSRSLDLQMLEVSVARTTHPAKSLISVHNNAAMFVANADQHLRPHYPY